MRRFEHSLNVQRRQKMKMLRDQKVRTFFECTCSVKGGNEKVKE